MVTSHRCHSEVRQDPEGVDHWLVRIPCPEGKGRIGHRKDACSEYSDDPARVEQVGRIVTCFDPA